MRSYLEIVEDVLDNGEHKHPTRDGVPVENDTIGLFGVVFEHDMSKGFPLLTTKKMPFKTICVELEGFIKGVTSKSWYQERGCKIWDEWANKLAIENTLAIAGDMLPSEAFLDNGEPDYKFLQKECDDLGPYYAWQWRRFNQVYDEDDDGCVTRYDQFKTVCDTLRSNPYDRRMVVSAWNPVQYTRMALPPCHFAWNVVVYGDKLNLIWHQRSVDLMTGCSFNIASYGLLLLLLAKHAGLKPGILKGTLNDCHIYLNHIEGAKKQIARNPYDLPRVNIKSDDIFEWKHEDVELLDYNHHPRIRYPITV